MAFITHKSLELPVELLLENQNTLLLSCWVYERNCKTASKPLVILQEPVYNTVVVPLVMTAIIAYLWGSLPSGYWMGKLLRGRNFDIREHGSHKIGATNVQRTLGIGPALIVL